MAEEMGVETGSPKSSKEVRTMVAKGIGICDDHGGLSNPQSA